MATGSRQRAAYQGRLLGTTLPDAGSNLACDYDSGRLAGKRWVNKEDLYYRGGFSKVPRVPLWFG